MSLEKTPMVLVEVMRERERQEELWGEQTHPSVSFPEAAPATREAIYGVPSEAVAKDRCERAFRDGVGTYADIAVEEMAEVIAAGNEADRRAELVQLAAVCVAWIESIDRQEAANV